MIILKRSLSAFFILLLISCGGKELKDETADWSAQKLYSEAKSELNSGNYKKSVQYYEILESRYPYGRYAQQAQLDIAYAYFKDNEPTLSVAACDRFIKLHPNHPNVDYAYYLKGLVNFNEDQGFLGRLSKQDLTERDPKAARDSFDALKELVTRFPESPYASDALARMKYLVNALASHDVHVAAYYMRRGAYIAAVNRAQSVLQNYQEAPAVEEALSIMAKGYAAMGLNDLSMDTVRVLRKNFPNSIYLAAEGEKKKSWWKFW